MSARMAADRGDGVMVYQSSYDPNISVWQQREWDRQRQEKQLQEERRRELAKRCTADNTSCGQCKSPGSRRLNPADGAGVGHLCMRHFRQLYPVIAPPAPPKPAKPAPCSCGFGQRGKTWTYCPGCGERLSAIGET